jgi:hypothetical protein
MVSTTLQNQNPQGTAAQLPFDNTVEASNALTGKRKYRFPVELQGMVREEDWEFMDKQQQITLIKTIGKDPEQFLVDVITDQSGLNIVRNIPEGFDRIEQIQGQAAMPPAIQNKIESAAIPVSPVMNVETVSTEFQNVKQELITEEQSFRQGETRVSQTLQEVQPVSQPIVITEEDKARIQAEKGGAPAWMPKLFGYKPSASIVSQATSNSKSDDDDIDASRAVSWLTLLLKKLFNKASQAGV